MSLTVKINIKDDEGKEAELEIKETDHLTKLVIIQNVFQLFGIDNDIFETVKMMEQIGKKYSTFFEKINPIENVKKETIQKNREAIKRSLIDGLQQTKQLEEVYQSTTDQPEWVATGIKTTDDGKKRYRCRYECPNCHHMGTNYIYKKTKEIKCYACRGKMKVHPAHPDGFPPQDTYGNFFRAGVYVDYRLT